MGQHTGAAPVAVRMGFAVDVVGYSGRAALAKLDAQERVVALVNEVLRAMNLDLTDTDYHGTGDGMVVFLPATAELHRTLPRLLRTTAEWLGQDNGRYQDRLRLRMAAAVGPFGRAAIGFSGNTIIECGRLVDSQVLRDAITENPAADVAVLVSDNLHTYVIKEGHPGLDGAEFRPVDVHVKGFTARAWLWVPAGGNLLPGASATAPILTDRNVRFGAVDSHRRSLGWPHRVGIMPAQADCFQSRQVDADLYTMSTGRLTAAFTQVLSGLGGVGKTQLAARVARHLWSAGEVDLLLWVTASSRQAIVTGYAQAGADVEAGDSADAEQAAVLFLSWLQQTDRRWLVVLDDVTDPGDVRGLWPPDTEAGRVVVTTRRRDAVLSTGERQLIEVGLFTPAESMGYLRQKLGGAIGRLVQADGLAADLGHLPLALAQAAAYLLDRSLDCAAYRRRFADRRRRLADLVPEDGALPDDHQATVATTWSLSAELADGLQPVGLARPSLQLVSLFGSNGVPEEVLTSAEAIGFLASQRPGGQPVSSDDAADALHCLHRLNLVSIDETSGVRVVHVHALVQRTSREHMSRDSLDRATRSAVAAVLSRWPDHEPRDRPSWDRCASLLPHANAVLGHADRLGNPTSVAAFLKCRVALYLWYRGDRDRAEDLFRQALANHGQVLGERHPDTLTTRHDLARVLRDQHRFDDAEREFRSVLGLRRQVFGDDHQRTLDTRHELALVLRDTGRIDLAEVEMQAVLDIRRRVLGDDHPHTLGARYNLAHLRRGQHRDEDERQFRAMLDTHRLVLGDDHIATLDVRHELALVLRDTGRADQAEAELQTVLDIRRRVLGDEHIDTLAGRQELAHLMHNAGRAELALHHLQAVVDARRQILGDNHPDTVAACRTLDLWLGEAAIS